MADFSERLCELRNEKGVSQKKAAAELNVSQALLSHYEKGIREFGLDFLKRAAKYYNVTSDYILGLTDSRSGLNTEALEDRNEDKTFNSLSIYRAAIMTHERIDAGSSVAGEKTDMLYAVTVYRTLFTAAQNGYIPKRWFSLPPKYAKCLPISVTESILSEFPEKLSTARRYGGPEPASIETLIKSVENAIRKITITIKPLE